MRRSGLLFVSLPLLGLAGDLFSSPVIFNGCRRTQRPQLVELVRSEVAPLGSYLGHDFFVSLDDMLDSKYLNYVKGRPSGLVIAVDHDDPTAPVWGGSAKAALRKLNDVSPPDAEALTRYVRGRDPQSGQVVDLPLQIPANPPTSFPLDHILLIGIKAQSSTDEDRRKSEQYITAGFQAVMQQSNKLGLTNLVVPSIGIDPADPSTMQARQFYSLVLSTSTPSWRPRNVFFPIYRGWLDDRIRHATLVSLEDAWDAVCAKAKRDAVLVHEDIRIVLISLFLCLLVSSRYLALSLKNFLIIAVSFTGLAYAAAGGFVNNLMQDWSALGRFVVHLVLLLLLALLFPVLPRWNPAHIFGRQAERRDD